MVDGLVDLGWGIIICSLILYQLLEWVYHCYGLGEPTYAKRSFYLAVAAALSLTTALVLLIFLGICLLSNT